MSRQQAIYGPRGNTESQLPNEQTAARKRRCATTDRLRFWNLSMIQYATQPKVDTGCRAPETVNFGEMDTAVTMLTGVVV